MQNIAESSKSGTANETPDAFASLPYTHRPDGAMCAQCITAICTHRKHGTRRVRWKPRPNSAWQHCERYANVHHPQRAGVTENEPMFRRAAIQKRRGGVLADVRMSLTDM